MFNLSIKTDNAAFANDCRREVARILKDIADRLTDGRDDLEGPARDINGNLVGAWSLE